LLAQALEERETSVSRWAIGVFTVFFNAYNAAAGIATGFVRRNTQGLLAERQAAVYEVVKVLRPYVALIIAVYNDIDPSPNWDINAGARKSFTSSIHPRL
jgi:hypothetical protein